MRPAQLLQWLTRVEIIFENINIITIIFVYIYIGQSNNQHRRRRRRRRRGFYLFLEQKPNRLAKSYLKSDLLARL